MAAVFGALAIYVLGRKVRLGNVWWVMLVGDVLNLVAAIWLFADSSSGVIMFMIISSMGSTISDTVGYSVTMHMIDRQVKGDDTSRQYSYIFDTELFYNLGRLSGVALFLLFSYIWGVGTSVTTVMIVAGLARIGADYFQYRLRSVINK